MYSQIGTSFIPAVGSFLAVASCVTCYVMAAALGDVPAWLPLVADTAKYIPTAFIFRGGMVTASCFLAYLWIVVRGWLLEEQDTIHESVKCRCGFPASFFGVLGCGALIVSVSVVEVDGTTPATLNLLAAEAFFVCSFLAQLFSTLTLVSMCRHQAFISSRSLRLKIALTGGVGLVLAVDIVLGALDLKSSFPYAAVCEWLLVFMVFGYTFSFTFDLYGRVALVVIVPVRSISPKGPSLYTSLIENKTVFNSDI